MNDRYFLGNGNYLLALNRTFRYFQKIKDGDFSRFEELRSVDFNDIKYCYVDCLSKKTVIKLGNEQTLELSPGFDDTPDLLYLWINDKLHPTPGRDLYIEARNSGKGIMQSKFKEIERITKRRVRGCIALLLCIIISTFLYKAFPDEKIFGAAFSISFLLFLLWICMPFNWKGFYDNVNFKSYCGYSYMSREERLWRDI